MTIPAIFKLGHSITLVPVIHGSGDYAIRIRQFMLDNEFDCLAVPLPESFQAAVTAAVELLPIPTVVVQRAYPGTAGLADWTPNVDREDSSEDPSHFHDDFSEERDDGEDDVTDGTQSYVPIDPCQSVIAALRLAAGERIPVEFIDLETNQFDAQGRVSPDAYALKKVSLARFAAAILPTVDGPPQGQALERVRYMARRLQHLEQRYPSTLCLCSFNDWPWIRQYFQRPAQEVPEHDLCGPIDTYRITADSLTFMLGELPFVTALYEKSRRDLEDDENLSVDGVKELLLEAREVYLEDHGKRARKISPHMLSIMLKYIRNLTLIDRRLTPDLFTIVTAAKQVAGDGFALSVAEMAREYGLVETVEQELRIPFDQAPREFVDFGINRARLPNGDLVEMVSRLPGSPVQWRSLQLSPLPDIRQQERWQMRWNPFGQCSWPPEDTKIEDFRTHVTERAKAILGADLARTEKFTTSVMDGIDIRETLRNWHTGELYVKVLPPSRGELDAVVMLFDSPADPRDYPWRTTWYAEHQNESTLSFYASNFREQMVGPGIGLATYGGALFLFPPRKVPDIWSDRRLDFAETLEERILAAACMHSRCPQIALVAPGLPGAAWRKLAKRFRKRWLHLPLSGFSNETIAQLRMVHVLNGHEVRSYASHFIRKA